IYGPPTSAANPQGMARHLLDAGVALPAAEAFGGSAAAGGAAAIPEISSAALQPGANAAIEGLIDMPAGDITEFGGATAESGGGGEFAGAGSTLGTAATVVGGIAAGAAIPLVIL